MGRLPFLAWTCRSIEDVAPAIEHNGTVPVWWLVNPREMLDITKGGHLELVSEFEVAGGGYVDPHNHPTHEFYYVTVGRGIMEIEGEDARDPPGRPRAHPADGDALAAPGHRQRADPLLLLRRRHARTPARSTTPSIDGACSVAGARRSTPPRRRPTRSTTTPSRGRTASRRTGARCRRLRVPHPCTGGAVGTRFLERGTMAARFHRPVYDGDEITVEAVEDRRWSDARRCSTRGANVRDGDGVAARGFDGRAGDRRLRERTAAGRSSPRVSRLLRRSPEFGSLEFGFHAEHAATYLPRDPRDAAAVRGRTHRPPRLASPIRQLRPGRERTARAVDPRVERRAASRTGARRRRSVHRARVVDDFERKGHKFVVLDVLVVANLIRPVMRVEHTAIYEPRHT